MLAPFALIYGALTGFRNFLYDKKIFKSTRFDFPIISVGNLSAGGTGKTPHIEYLIVTLQYLFKVATLSRGYGRKSHGFVLADFNTPATQIGDEPRQFKAKYPETIVSVCEDRVLGVPQLLTGAPQTDVILLDDAFQHRAIMPGLSILVTEYGNLFTRDYVFPMGWLRESRAGYHRADIIIVSKCPSNLSTTERDQIIAEIKPYRYQKIYFTAIEYGAPYLFTNAQVRINLDKDLDVLLLCGIARFEALKTYLESKVKNVYVRDYKDHHNYDRYDLEAIRETINNIDSKRKIIVTTEKDAARLQEHGVWFTANKIDIFVQPINVQFLFGGGEQFNADILQYITATKEKIASN